MKIAEYISKSIDRLPKVYVVTYADFMAEVKSKEAVIKALNRMTASGKIVKLSKVKYYKPGKSTFGKLQPNRYQVVKDPLGDDGKITGYLNGYSIYNKLGLTTQKEYIRYWRNYKNKDKKNIWDCFEESNII